MIYLRDGDAMIVYDLNDMCIQTTHWEFGKSQYWILCSSDEVKHFDTIFSLDSITECLDYKQIPRIDFYKNYTFVVFNVLTYFDSQILSKEIDIYLGSDFIVTVSKESIDLISHLIREIKNGRNCVALNDLRKPYIVLYYILDRIIINNYSIIADIEGRADQFELTILKGPKSKHINEFVMLRREAFKLRKLLSPLRYVGDTLMLNENNLIDKENLYLFRNINSKIDKLMNSMDTLTQSLAMVREAYESEIANKTNDLIKAFTIITAVFLPLQLITAMFGMSFDYMPLKTHEFAFYGLLGFMIIIVIFLLAIFKWKKIL